MLCSYEAQGKRPKMFSSKSSVNSKNSNRSKSDTGDAAPEGGGSAKSKEGGESEANAGSFVEALSPRSGVSAKVRVKNPEQADEDLLRIVFEQLARGQGELSAGDLTMRLQDLQGCRVDAKLVHQVVKDLKGCNSTGKAFMTAGDLIDAMETHYDGVDPYADLTEIWLLLGGRMPRQRGIIGGGEQARIPAKKFYEGVRKLGGDLAEHEVEGLIGLVGGQDGMLSYDSFVNLLTPPWGRVSST